MIKTKVDKCRLTKGNGAIGIFIRLMILIFFVGKMPELLTKQICECSELKEAVLEVSGESADTLHPSTWRKGRECGFHRGFCKTLNTPDRKYGKQWAGDGNLNLTQSSVTCREIPTWESGFCLPQGSLI